jgi:hypothetical protein
MCAALMAALSFVGSAAVSAATQITVTPYENLSTTSPTVVAVSGSGLSPNTTVAIRQVGMHSVESPEFTGVLVEQLHKATTVTDSQGSFSVQVSVQYDVRTDQTSSNFCQNDTILRRICYLNVQYQDDATNEVIAQPKLYFGVSGPVIDDPTPPTTPVSKDECFNGGWKNFGSMFENQGKCVAFVSGSNRNP